MAKIWNPACKTAVKWVTKSISRKARKRALERWETKRANREVISQVVEPSQRDVDQRQQLQFMVL
jgi:RNase P protein component